MTGAFLFEPGTEGCSRIFRPLQLTLYYLTFSILMTSPRPFTVTLVLPLPLMR